jgi:signal peptidase I
VPSTGGDPASGTDRVDPLIEELLHGTGRSSGTAVVDEPNRAGVGVGDADDLTSVLLEPEEDIEDEESAQYEHRVRAAVEWILVILGAIGVALLLKIFLFQAFYIPSSSMEPTLQIDDRVLVNKLSYDAHDVNRGDLIVFRRPEEISGDTRDLIKRVIGLPGESVSTDPDTGQVLIDGQPLIEPYLEPSVRSSGLETPVLVSEGHVFVMGDNRGNSQDSRVFGPIETDSIVGRAFIRVWPLDTIDFL